MKNEFRSSGKTVSKILVVGMIEILLVGMTKKAVIITAFFVIDRDDFLSLFFCFFRPNKRRCDTRAEESQHNNKVGASGQVQIKGNRKKHFNTNKS